MEPAIVLLSHGSRDPLWRAPMEAVAARIATLRPGRLVRCAYLELCPPSLAEVAGELVARGAAQVTVVPMFLGVGRHLREDMPRLAQQLRDTHPGVRFDVQPAIGADPRVAALLADIACEALPGLPFFSGAP